MPLTYTQNHLTLIQGTHKIDLVELAKNMDQAFYLYDIDGSLERLKLFQKLVDPIEIYFSLKSNNNKALVQSFLKEGAGLDIVSKGELEHSLNLKCSPKKIVFSGVAKTKQELEKALRSQIFQINVESLEELERIGSLCSSLKLKAQVACRVNPNVTLDTHAFIQTGTKDHKFGIDENALPQFIEIVRKYSSFVQFQGLAMHIGSQGLSVDPLIQASEKVKNIYERLNREGHSLTTLDIGGGVGIDYRTNDMEDDIRRIEFYGSSLQKVFKNFEGRLLCEPGRILTARYGWLFGEIQYIKKTSLRNFAILNTGMHHLMRPVLYQAYHRILPVKQSNQEEKNYTIAGPICESADILARDRLLPALSSGDWLCICDAGAYGAVMSQTYNMQDIPLEIAYSQGAIASKEEFQHKTK
ncbi:MAG: diaminopimelate decarboxylase [Bdellovibrionales bacterium]|nr:diaminopimelate decarboxylase [Bdellovibrionales bacterium]